MQKTKCCRKGAQTNEKQRKGENIVIRKRQQVKTMVACKSAEKFGEK